jgi:hypothetical protein
MMKRGYLVMPLVALTLVGAGCLRIGPRIVRSPAPSNIPDTTQIASSSVTTTQDVPLPNIGFSNEIRVLAYLRLDGGQAEVRRDGVSMKGEEGLELVSGDRVKVQTGPVSLIYPDAGETQIESDSEVVLMPHGEDAKTGEVATELELLAGRVWTRFERLLGPEESFSVDGNGVVATVRGTAFGVSLEGDDVDVQVADHEVEVTTVDEEEAALAATSTVLTTKSVKLATGEGLKIQPAQFHLMQQPLIKTKVRKLTDVDRTAQGYRFASQRIRLERLRKPAFPVRMKATPEIPPELRRRLQLLRKRRIRQLELIRFQAPTSSPTFTIPSTIGTTSTAR